MFFSVIFNIFVDHAFSLNLGLQELKLFEALISSVLFTVHEDSYIKILLGEFNNLFGLNFKFTGVKIERDFEFFGGIGPV